MGHKHKAVLKIHLDVGESPPDIEIFFLTYSEPEKILHAINDSKNRGNKSIIIKNSNDTFVIDLERLFFATVDRLD